MKVCDMCGDEIATKDGDNRCQSCEQAENNRKKKQRARLNRKMRDAAMESLGLKKVRGAMGGVYWE